METIIQIKKQPIEKKDHTIILFTPSLPIPIPKYQQHLNDNINISCEKLRQSPRLSTSFINSSLK